MKDLYFWLFEGCRTGYFLFGSISVRFNEFEGLKQPIFVIFNNNQLTLFENQKNNSHKYFIRINIYNKTMDEINEIFNEFQKDLEVRLQKLKYQVEFSYENKLDFLINELNKKDVVL